MVRIAQRSWSLPSQADPLVVRKWVWLICRSFSLCARAVWLLSVVARSLGEEVRIFPAGSRRRLFAVRFCVAAVLEQARLFPRLRLQLFWCWSCRKLGRSQRRSTRSCRRVGTAAAACRRLARCHVNLWGRVWLTLLFLLVRPLSLR